MIDDQREKSIIKNVNKLTDELIMLLSTTLVEMNNKVGLLKYYYDKLDWETEVCENLEEGMAKLGASLALLELDKRDSKQTEECK
jgi:hypothetical protein